MHQSRYTDSEKYFDELSVSSRKYYFPYLKEFKTFGLGTSILEIGCGEGGNLLPFSEAGCRVTGCDLSERKICTADSVFKKQGLQGEFFCCDVMVFEPGCKYDIIMIHDVVEHIEPEVKLPFFQKVKSLLKEDGIVFWAFPDWYMPFGGHQQILWKSKLSKCPWLHLLPLKAYEAVLKRSSKVPDSSVSELLSIRRSRMTIKSFEKLCALSGQRIIARRCWLVNPHYEVKFSLKPRKLPVWLSKTPVLRDVMSTSCHFITVKDC